MDAETHLQVFRQAAAAAGEAVLAMGDRSGPGHRAGQYKLDLVADDAACQVLFDHGYSVLSEESGRRGEGPLVVIDPIDGSTNASRGIPWYATCLCLLGPSGPEVGLVLNQASGVTYSAIRGEGSFRDGVALSVRQSVNVDEAIVAVTGLPPTSMPWWQFRALGAAALDLCLVAEGVLDGFAVVGTSRLYVWDYLASLLICAEAGAVYKERDGLDLAIDANTARRPVVTATSKLLDAISATFV